MTSLDFELLHIDEPTVVALVVSAAAVAVVLVDGFVTLVVVAAVVAAGCEAGVTKSKEIEKRFRSY